MAANHINGTFPEHVAVWWDQCPASIHAQFHGILWRAADLNYHARVVTCVRTLRSNGFALADAIAMAHFDDGLGPDHIPLLHQIWQEQIEAEAAKAAEEVAEHQRIAEHFTISDAPWEADSLPRRPWLAPPYLMRGQITLPHGPGGGGKSQLSIAWAIALALGRSFGRLRPVARARVMLTNFEDNFDEQRRRISAALEYFGATPDELQGWLYRAGMGPRADATMFALDGNGAVGVTDCWEAFDLACSRRRPDAIFLDPLVAVNAVPEQDNIMMRRVMVLLRNLAQRHNAAVVPMHHDNKAGDDTDGSDQSNVRGGTDIVNAVRFELAVKKMSVVQAEQMGVDPDQRGYYFRVGSVASKMNYSAPEESEWFQRHAVMIGGEEVVRCEPWRPPNGELALDQTDRLLAAIERGSATGPYSPQLSNTGRSLAPLLEEMGFGASSVQRSIIRELLRAGRVVKAKWKGGGHGGTHVWSGLRMPTGEPHNYEWQDGGGADE